MQQADGDAFDIVSLEGGDHGVHACEIQRNQHLAAGIDALGHRQAQVSRHQRLRLLHLDVVLLETILVGHLHGVTKALGDDERSTCAFAFDNGVGGERRAVNDDADVSGIHIRRFDDLGDTRHDALFRRRRGGQYFTGDIPVADGECDIGKGTADVDGKSDRRATQNESPLRRDRKPEH